MEDREEKLEAARRAVEAASWELRDLMTDRDRRDLRDLDPLRAMIRLAHVIVQRIGT